MKENTHTTPSTPAAMPVSKQVAVAIVMVAILATGLTIYQWATVPLRASITGSGSLSRSECFAQQRTGRMTPECKDLLFGPSSNNAWLPPSATDETVATDDPNAPPPSPKLPIGSKCLNDQQCGTNNCIPRDLAIDGGPSLWIGICGCRARPACLDAQPACALPETPDMCVCGNGKCEVGEKSSCRQDCASPQPFPSDAPSCSTCLRQGLGYLCRGGFTGGTFCNAEDGGTGADFRCVACADQPTKCVPEGQTCSTDTECGTCGAACQGQGMTDSIPPHIIAGTCLYPRVSASPLAMCDYAAPPEGCRYIPGPDYDPITACGLELECLEEVPTPSSSTSPVPRTCSERRGDVTCDQMVDIADLALMSDMLLGKFNTTLPDAAYQNADITQDDVLDIADLASLVAILVPLSGVQ